MEMDLFIKSLIVDMPPFTSYFSSGLEVENVGFMYQVVMKIYHKKTNVVIVKKEELFVSEFAYTNAFSEFLGDYFQDVEIFCLTGLTRIRKKPLELHNETFLQACEEFLLERGG